MTAQSSSFSSVGCRMRSDHVNLPMSWSRPARWITSCCASSQPSSTAIALAYLATAAPWRVAAGSRSPRPSMNVDGTAHWKLASCRVRLSSCSARRSERTSETVSCRKINSTGIAATSAGMPTLR